MANNIVTQNAAQIAGVIDIHRGKPMVSSLRIAELFERRHDNVLQAIRKELSDEIGALESKGTSYLEFIRDREASGVLS
jgi:phage regulator Rha-like protein